MPIKFTEVEKELIFSLRGSKLTLAEVQQQYPVSITKEYVQEHLRAALAQKDYEELRPAMTLMYSLSENSVLDEDLIHAFEQALVEDWHQKHEDIAFMLQKIKSPSSVHSLFQAATMSFDYLKNDEFYALARKCLWALGSINTPEARAMIYRLGELDNELIREHVEEQLERLGLD